MLEGLSGRDEAVAARAAVTVLERAADKVALDHLKPGNGTANPVDQHHIGQLSSVLGAVRRRQRPVFMSAHAQPTQGSKIVEFGPENEVFAVVMWTYLRTLEMPKEDANRS